MSVSLGRLTIIAVQTTIPSIGTNGTNGVLKVCVTPDLFCARSNAQTNKYKSKGVPIEVRSPATVPGTETGKQTNKTNKTRLLLYGVRNFG